MDSVCVVTVTYANRFRPLTRETVERAFLAGAAHVIIIDNGSSPESIQLMETTYGGRSDVTLEFMGQNTGSAPAFSRGIQIATDCNFPFILLLDDDNWIESDCLEKLLQTQEEAAIYFDDPLTTVSGFRNLDNSHVRVISGVPVFWTYPPSGAFMFFDLITQFKRSVCRPKKAVSLSLEQRCLPDAPYGGFLFPVPLLEEIGLPPTEIRLYADDTFWTSRAVARGHRIILDDSVTIHDADAKWARASGRGPVGLLNTVQLEKLYFSVRNRVLFENSLATSRSISYRYRLNKLIYIAISWMVSRRGDSNVAFSVFRQAVSDAELGRLDNQEWMDIGKP